MALAVKSVLKFCGYLVDVAASGGDALKLVQEAPEKFALVLTDHNMPGMSGLDLARGLYAMDYPGKVIILSALVTREMEAEVGVDRIILKPFDLKSFRVPWNTLHARKRLNARGGSRGNCARAA